LPRSVHSSPFMAASCASRSGEYQYNTHAHFVFSSVENYSPSVI